MNNKGFKREESLERKRYINDSYMDEVQLLTYVNQLKLVFDTIRDHFYFDVNILEVGIGNGFVSNALKTYDINVTTFDINGNLNPDYVGNILEATKIINKRIFDIVLCSEVLEHMDFSYFEKSLVELKSISKILIITLPNFKRHYGIYGLLKIPNRILHINCGIEIGFKKLPKEHFWEIGSDTISSRMNIEQIINKHFSILDKGKFNLNNYHHYYVLKRK